VAGKSKMTMVVLSINGMARKVSEKPQLKLEVIGQLLRSLARINWKSLTQFQPTYYQSCNKILLILYYSK